MTGEIDEFGIPVVRLTIGGREWVATIDTGFNGDLEMPHEMAQYFAPVRSGDARRRPGDRRGPLPHLVSVRRRSSASGGRVRNTDGILIGTNLLQDQLLEINFVTRTVVLEKVATP